MDDDGFSCCMEQHLNDSGDDRDDRDDEHYDNNHDDDDDHRDDNDHYDDHNHNLDDHDNATNCSMMYQVCRSLILEIGLTTEACLNGTSKEHRNEEHVHSLSDSKG